MTVHTALQLRGARLDGEALAVERTVAFGHDAITALIEIPPGEQRVLEVDVAGPLALGPDDYRITLPFQPLVNADLISLRTVIDGVENVISDDLLLTRDTVLGPGTD